MQQQCSCHRGVLSHVTIQLSPPSIDTTTSRCLPKTELKLHWVMEDVLNHLCALTDRDVEKYLGGAQGATTFLRLKDVVITSDLGPVTISITICSPKLHRPLMCQLQSCVIAGKPSAITADLQSAELVNHSPCDGLQLSLSFVDDQGGQVTNLSAATKCSAVVHSCVCFAVSQPPHAFCITLSCRGVHAATRHASKRALAVVDYYDTVALYCADHSEG